MGYPKCALTFRAGQKNNQCHGTVALARWGPLWITLCYFLCIHSDTYFQILDLNSQSRTDPMDFFFMSNRGKRSDFQEEEDLDFQRTLRKLMVSRPHSLFLYRPDMVKRLLNKRGGNFQRPNGLLISMGKRGSPLGFSNPLLYEMLEAAKEEAVVDESRSKRLRISPLGFNNPLLNKLLKEMENKPKRGGDDVFDTFNGVRG